MPTTRLARRRTPIPMIFGSRFPDVTDIMDEALSLFPAFPELTSFPPSGIFPVVNLSEDALGYTITAELPGLTEKEVKVDFTNGVLTISGEKIEEHSNKENGTRYHIWERRAGSFQRSFPFPGGIAEDKIVADFKNGLLNIHLPKAPEEQEKKLSIKINAK
jgi:HSP20 family molecular chaperone IbpA